MSLRKANGNVRPKERTCIRNRDSQKKSPKNNCTGKQIVNSLFSIIPDQYIALHKEEKEEEKQLLPQ